MKIGTKVLIPATITAMDARGQFVVVNLDNPNPNHPNGTEVGGLHIEQMEVNEDAELQSAADAGAKTKTVEEPTE